MLVKQTFDADLRRLHPVSLRLKIHYPFIHPTIRSLVSIDWKTLISPHYTVLNTMTSQQILHFCVLFHSLSSYFGT